MSAHKDLEQAFASVHDTSSSFDRTSLCSMCYQRLLANDARNCFLLHHFAPLMTYTTIGEGGHEDDERENMRLGSGQGKQVAICEYGGENNKRERKIVTSVC